ncbi:unnamed protein product [Chilo suppressalis]|uniref:Major facilitator superfamily (MFS) profile domain-containing protein n=1 Tax=Chilo suppressalis TaxID=168631 RepID=A0ABN8B5U0_CHISP|nr:unnamed protein product [Chilo suppressalis]
MGENVSRWITPFTKQCWVCGGVGLNMLQMGLIFGISSTLLPQLRESGSPIPIDEEDGSWIAAVPGITLIGGNLIVPVLMGKFGRKIANIASIVILGVGWCCILLASNVTTLLIARSLHGVGMGMISTLGPVVVGEYTTPANRGAFLMSLAVSIAVGVLAVHAMGSYLTWKTVSIICACLNAVTLLIVLCSPESPSWLASQGRYDKCKTIFRWLRGDNEEKELDELINANMKARKFLEEQSSLKSSQPNFMVKLKQEYQNFKDIVKNREFFLPIIIMFHVSGLGQWSGINFFCSYGMDFIDLVIGKGVDAALILISLDFQRAVSTTIGLAIVKKIKRKTLMNLSIGLNLLAMMTTAAYVYFKTHNLLPFDSIYIGIALLHIQMFPIAIGGMPLLVILSGELFPLRFKSLAGGISAVLYSLTIFVSIKTVPFLLNNLQLTGMFLVYAALSLYCLGMANVFLPETKDKTLQAIEEEFKGVKKPVQPMDVFTTKPV